MLPFERRGLTVGERRLAELMFGDEIDARTVRLVQIPRATFGAMVPHRRTIIFANWRACRDFAHAPATERGWFVHELTHVWQAQRGAWLAAAKLTALGRDPYRYALAPGKPFWAYNIEQQAEIARHLYLARAGVPAPDAASMSLLNALWPVRSP
jgi:hypothetical protein